MNTHTQFSESAVHDGGELTAEETRLAALPLDGSDASTADADAAALAEQQRLDAAAAAQATADAARVAADAAAVADTQQQVEAPTPPDKPGEFDYDAKKKALVDEYDAGSLTPQAYADKLAELTEAKINHQFAQRDYETAQKQFDADATAAAEKRQTDWATAATAWEANNAHFMSNELRARHMQDAIRVVGERSRAAKESLTHQQVLERAQKIAFDFIGYTPPEGTEAAAAEKAALEARKAAAGKVDKTLGDVPAAKAQDVGTPEFSALDALDIEKLEEATAHMTPAQQERYLRDAPGANSRGRGDDPADTKE